MTPEQIDAMVLQEIAMALKTGWDKDRWYAAGMIFTLEMTEQISFDKAKEYHKVLGWGSWGPSKTGEKTQAAKERPAGREGESDEWARTEV